MPAPAHRWRIPRARIVERIRRSANRRVALLAAGAGFGKSIAVQAALDVGAGDAFYRVASDATTLLGFVRGLTDALEESVPGAHLSLAIAYERAIVSPSPAAELARWLAEHLREASLRIVIDDLHHATAGEVPEFVRRSIEASPERVRWLLATRDASALPVASWLAHGVCDLPIGEADLRFTPEELAALAAQVAPSLSPERLDEIERWTDGWPSATGLALMLGDADLPPAATTPLEGYRRLAARVVEGIGAPQQAALLQSAIFVDVSAATASENAFLDDSGEGRLRYNNLFREFLLERLRQDGSHLERGALVEAAAAAVRGGDVRSALAFYQRAAMPQALGDILAANGVALLDGGFADVVEEALAALDRAGFDGGPAIMLLKALRDSYLVRFDSAEAWFQLAILAADDDDLRLRIVHRYSLDLMRRGRVDAIDVLETAIASAPAGHAFHPLLCATLATAYALVDRFDEAQTSIESAMKRLSLDLPVALRTRAFHQAAYVALRRGDPSEARWYAERVLGVAVPNGYYDLAARAHSVLYEIEHAWEANPECALAHVESVAEYGLKSGDVHLRQWALFSAYYIEAERGDTAMMSTIENALNAPDILQTVGDSSAALLPGQALRATWSGDFAYAYRLLARSAEGQVSADRRALRWSELALFGAAAGFTAEARAAAGAARIELAQTQTGKFATQAAAYLLIALSLFDDRPAWITVHNAVGAIDRDRAAGNFLRVAEALQEHWYQARDHQAVLASLNALRDAQFGGIAAMLEALPAVAAEDGLVWLG